MKPTNNRIFCIGCNRPKMLFESQSKADNFIRFNIEEIAIHSHKVPTRSYYCTFCCGWHVTSVNERDRAEYNDTRDEKLWEQIYANRFQKLPYNELRKQIEPLLADIDKLLEQLKNLLWNTELEKANECFKEATLKYTIIDEVIKRSKKTFSAIENRKSKIISFQNTLNLIDEFELNYETCQKYLAEHSPLNQQNIISQYFENKMFLAEIQELYELAETAFANKDNREFNRLKELISEKFKTTKCIGLARKRKEYEMKLSSLIKREVYLKPSKRQVQENKKTLISIIGYLEKAYEAYNDSNFERCRNLLNVAECLLPGICDETEMILVAQIEKITQMLDDLNFIR